MLYVTKQNEYLIHAFMRNHITNRPHAAARVVRPRPARRAPRPAAKQLRCWQQAAPNKHSANSVGKALIRKAIIIGVIALNYPPNRERRSDPERSCRRPARSRAPAAPRSAAPWWPPRAGPVWPREAAAPTPTLGRPLVHTLSH